ncbi:hypothetical protein PO909_016859 [Leuciscus waleckii]
MLSYIPGHQNVGTDILLRQGLRPREWRLHPEVVEHIWEVYGQAEVDLFAFQDTTHCQLFTVNQPVGLAFEGSQHIDSGLSTEVAETILHSRALSTRKLYALKWKVFTSWCNLRQWNPVNCPVGSILEFLQDRFTAGLSPSTLKVYVAATEAYHVPLGGLTVGRDPLKTRFLRDTLRLRPTGHTRVPAWDLAMVLEGLSVAPFEPLDSVSEKFLTLKTVLLLAISSLNDVSLNKGPIGIPSCLEFAPGMVKAFLYPKPGYFPKVPTNVLRPIVLQAFCPPPFKDQGQEKVNLICPVRALDTYVHRAALWRKSDQLLVCFGSPKKGLPASKQTVSKWIVEAISLAYEASGQPSPLAIRAHSTRSMAASKALISGVSLHEVCDVAGWSSPLTFVRFHFWTWVPLALEFLCCNCSIQTTGSCSYGVRAFSFSMTFPSMQRKFPRKDCNPSSLRREQRRCDTLPYFLHPCDRIASAKSKLTQVRLDVLLSFPGCDITRP